ncbi:hypothetical protein LZ318_22110 [Saccharopolyspora indica]|uniref:hypothetical protein n=1 Tax=Saccharopolyspora indica TaxID=1229659 RepID=UPI0022EAB3E6|nr:hypothetical protein [Saccharopolyspora indica]MDA3648100.1 hypothetical protein [Saccharopolyspora indica]
MERDEGSRDHLFPDLPLRAEVVFEDPCWSVAVPGLPVAADGATLDEALSEAIAALREYADDWQERLLHAPNHQVHRDCVLLVRLSDDGQLRDRLLGKECALADRAG